MRSASGYVMRETAEKVAREVAKDASRPLARLISLVAPRFQAVVSEKTVAQLLPVVGAATGGALNVAFIDHYNHVARYHFGLKVLEARCGDEEVRAAYARELERLRRQ
jgi:uncharacterized membrane protein